MGYNNVKNESGMYTIRGPKSCIYFGAAGVFIGFLFAGFCLYSKMQGNPTATTDVMLLFLAIFSTLGIWLISYGYRTVTIQKKEITLKRLFHGIQTMPLSEIKRVKWVLDGYVFYGNRGKLFKICEITPESEYLLWNLIKEGIKVIPPAHSYTLPQKTDYDCIMDDQKAAICFNPKTEAVLIFAGLFVGLVPAFADHLGRKGTAAFWCLAVLFFTGAFIASQRKLVLAAGKLQKAGFLTKHQECFLNQVREVRLDLEHSGKRLVMKSCIMTCGAWRFGES